MYNDSTLCVMTVVYYIYYNDSTLHCMCNDCSLPYILVGCKHRASEVLLYIGGRGLVSQIIEPVTFARCAFIIALWNIALDGYLDTRRNI